MPSFGQLIGIAAMGKTLFTSLSYQRLLPRLAVLIALAMMTAIMASILAAGICFAGYQLLIRHGLDGDMAFIVIGIAVFGLTGAFAAWTVACVNTLCRTAQASSPIASGINDISNAFINGLLTSSKNS